MSLLSSPRLSHFIVLSALTACGACTTLSKPSNHDTTNDPKARPPATFGETLGASEIVPLVDVLASANDYAGRTIKVQGHVRRACSAKGCWMELAQDQSPQAPACRVTFKDYGFFVPTDSAGAHATIEGQVAVKRVRAAQVRHYEAEGASFPIKHEDGTADEVRFVATGVELRRL